MSQYRTHTCGELRAADAGKTVTLAGWMENVREVGSNFAFVVLRDFYGTTQIVVDSAEMMKTVKGINKESTIAVTGTVRLRESPNTKLATGEIEVVPEKIEILGRCRYNELPFEINRSREADESARLKYRYLDLRNPAVKNNIILRCNVVAALVAMGISMFGVSLVAMNTFAFGIRCAGPFAAYGLGLAVPKATKNSGMISIFTGTIAFVVWQLLSNGGTLWFMMPVVFGSLVSVITFYVVNLIEWKRGVPAAPSAYAVEKAK